MSGGFLTPVDMQAPVYLTLADCWRANARRHMKRAHAHALAGEIDYAAGSLAKSVRHLRRSELAGNFAQSDFVSRVTAAIEDSLINGV